MTIENDHKRVDQPAPWSMKMVLPDHLRVRERERVMKFVVAIQREYCETGRNAKTAQTVETNVFEAELVLPQIFVTVWQGKYKPPRRGQTRPQTQKNRQPPPSPTHWIENRQGRQKKK